MIKTDRVDVFMGGRHVGTLAETKHRAAFQYSGEWLETGFAISPFSLPLESRLFIPEYEPFEGLFGVFADTMPDGWGRLVVDRYIKHKFGMDADEIDSLQRLTLISDSGMGALNYKPAIDIFDEEFTGSYDELARDCRQLLEDDFAEDLDRLFQLGGSSGGARPKIHAKIDGADWIIKFPSSFDGKDIGMQEYAYSLCAKDCGIEMSETRLFDSKLCGGYFECRRHYGDTDPGVYASAAEAGVFSSPFPCARGAPHGGGEIPAVDRPGNRRDHAPAEIPQADRFMRSLL